MRASVLSSFGDAGQLRPAIIPDPAERPGWVTVRLVASALNWHDVLVREGRYDSPLPHVIGADGAGRRADTGEEVVILPSLSWGDDESAPGSDWEILGDRTPGTYAEAVSVPEECVFPKPAGLGWFEAAALPLVGVTVYRALHTRGRLRAGESVLILGAGGGVATMALSLANAIGARAWVTSSTRDKIDRAIASGAVDGVSYASQEWAAEAKRMSPSGRGFDVVLDSVGTWQDSIAALRPGGRLVVLGASRAEHAQLAVRPFYFGQYELVGTTMGSVHDFAGLLRLMATASVAPPVIDSVYPLDRAADAHTHLESGAAFGKIVLGIE